jgi:hypothetical protein
MRCVENTDRASILGGVGQSCNIRQQFTQHTSVETRLTKKPLKTLTPSQNNNVGVCWANMFYLFYLFSFAN